MAMIATNPLFGSADYTANRWSVIAGMEGIKPAAYADSGSSDISVGK